MNITAIQRPLVGSIIQGSANQVLVTANSLSVGQDITLSLPQDINTTSSPTFAGLTVNGTFKILESGGSPAQYAIFSIPPLTVSDQTYSFPNVQSSIVYSILGTFASIDNYINQAVKTTSSPTFANIIDSGLTASLGVYTDGSKQLTSTPPTSGILGYWSRTGTVISPATSGDTVNLSDGSASVPSLSFVNDTDTGIWRDTTNQMMFSTGGAGDTLKLTQTAFYFNYYNSSFPSLNGPQFNFQRARGTYASPVAVGSGDILLWIRGSGYYTSGGTGYSSAAAIKFKTEEAFTSTAAGGRIEFLTTTTGTVTQVLRTTLDGSGNIIHQFNMAVGKATAPTSTVDCAGSFSLPYSAQTSTYSITSTDYQIDCTSGTFTVTLPTAVSITGRIYSIKNSGTGIITLGFVE